jgi:hypothetical protein
VEVNAEDECCLFAPSGAVNVKGQDTPAALLRTSDTGIACLFVAPHSDLSINGSPAADLGVHVLVHKDEIRSAGRTFYFTTEELPEVIVFEGQACKCGRCRAAISEGAQAIRCLCGVWYHHGDPSCFEYGELPLCVACRRPTLLDGSALWCPEEVA